MFIELEGHYVNIDRINYIRTGQNGRTQITFDSGTSINLLMEVREVMDRIKNARGLSCK